MHRHLAKLIIFFFTMMSLSGLSSPPVSAQVSTPPNFKVAFIGDTGYEAGFQGVLDLIKAENAQLVLHQGDFAYNVGVPPDDWVAMINTTLGNNFPYLGSVGNHDKWSEYVPFFKDRLTKMGFNPNLIDASNRKYAVQYQGLNLVFDDEYESDPTFLKNSLSGNSYIWQICSWHHNQNDFQPGRLKTNEPAWAVYQTCQDYGAIVATGHEHTYGRTYTLTGLQADDAHTIQAPADSIQLLNAAGAPGQGKNFVFVNGLGGKSRRTFYCPLHDDDTWWASVFASNYHLKNGTTIGKDCGCSSSFCPSVVPNYGDGALFIIFNVDNNPHKAHAYFKTSAGNIIDEFNITSQIGSVPTVTPGLPSATPGNPSITPTPKPIVGDANGDNAVDYLDVHIFISTFGSTTDLRADFNSDGKVDLIDAISLYQSFGTKN